MTPRGNEVESVVTLAKDQSALLPLHAIYTPTAELFFCVEGYIFHHISISAEIQIENIMNDYESKRL